MANPTREQRVKDLTSYLMHRHYCEGDLDTVIASFDDQLSWFGAGENEHAIGTENVSAIFRKFTGKIPRCVISDEEYHVQELTPDYYVCSGRMWIATHPSTQIYMRQHQRITLVVHFVGDEPRVCHIHNSNPYGEMSENEIGFPTQMSILTYEYMQEQIAAQKKQIEEQTAKLKRLSFEDTMTGLFNRNKFNYLMETYQHQEGSTLGVAYFDINGLKVINDRHGHAAGDKLLSRAAKHIQDVFPGKAYRVGGDEFVVMDEELNEEAFYQQVCTVCKNMDRDKISCTVGISWRSTECDLEQQFEDADRRMYRAKEEFYRIHGKTRNL